MNKLIIITLALALAAGTAHAGYYCDIDPDTTECQHERRAERRDREVERMMEESRERLRHDEREYNDERRHRELMNRLDDADRYLPRRRYYR